ncbi:hypothetical protein Tco_0802005 [Tanacetum coccineum]|uniref:Uncharacterized protein n=1 Tax=Tanacetum coccineum TaxID=301880 RepID=A0ABQ5A1S8_9ASTR
MGEPLGAEVDDLMVDLVIDEIVEPIIEVEEQMVALVMDIEGDLALLFGDDDDSGDDGLDDEEDDAEVWELDEEWLMAPVTPPPMPVMPPPSTYKIGPRVSVVEGQATTQRDEAMAGLSQQVQTLQAAVQDRDLQIQQLQTFVTEFSSREGFQGGWKPRWFSSEIESEKWRRLLLHQMCVAIDEATDSREEDFFPRNGKQW